MTETAGDLEAPASAPLVGPGAALREAREACHLDAEAVAKQLRIDVALVRALEADDYAKFAAPIFVTGYLRAYARMLDLDPGSVVGAYQRLGLGQPPGLTRVVREATPPMTSSPAIPYVRRGVYLVIAVILAVAFFFWRLQDPGLVRVIPETASPFSSPSPASGGASSLGKAAGAPPPAAPPAAGRPAPSAGAASPSTPPSADAAPAPAAPPARLGVSADKASWVEVKDATGKRLFFDLMDPGEHRTLEGVPPFDVLLGYAPGISLEYNGAPVDRARYASREVARVRVGGSER